MEEKHAQDTAKVKPAEEVKIYSCSGWVKLTGVDQISGSWKKVRLNKPCFLFEGGSIVGKALEDIQLE